VAPAIKTYCMPSGMEWFPDFGGKEDDSGIFTGPKVVQAPRVRAILSRGLTTIQVATTPFAHTGWRATHGPRRK
jgi:hypothetical protein